MSHLESLFLHPWAPYLPALVAAGLLPIKKRPAYCGVCLALALVWGAVAAHAIADSPPGSHPSFWMGLAITEAALFLIASVKLELEVRTGPWALAGTAFIVYSLLVFPLVGRVSEIDWFKSSALFLPFPPVLFTCGVLFFAVNRKAPLLLALPFLWALAGGPDDSAANFPELLGLQVSLLAGALFFALPPELRGAGDPRAARATAYRVAHRRRTIFGYGLWTLILTTGFLWYETPIARQLPPLVPLHLALLCGLGTVLWLVFPAWQSLWYRSVAWWTARAGGRIWAGLQNAWRWVVLLLGIAALLVWLINLYSKPEISWIKRLAEAKWPLWSFLAAILLWFVYHAYRGRTRLVIGEFTVHPADDATVKWATGLGARLEDELARIAGVYRVIDAAVPPQKAMVIEVIPKVDEVGTILEEASAIDLGTKLKIPTKQLMTLVGRLVSGPRLTGSLHKVGGELILMAELNGGGLLGNWRVDHNKLSEEERRLPEEDRIDKLIEQLAFRIATDLVAIGSPRWRAVRCFTDGLRAYRETARQRDKAPQLREAERFLIRALKDDQKFVQCHYNLGVVYRQLEELGSAESAFRRTLQENPDNFEACYALAETLVHGERSCDGLWFCEAAIAIDAADPRAWDLAAYARRHSAQDARGPEVRVALPPGDPVWKEILEMSEIAVALAWRSLCRWAWNRTPAALAEERACAFLCTRNLAVVLTRAGLRFAESRQVFQQAARLSPHDPNLRLYEGRTLLWSRRWKNAAQLLGGVFEDGLLTEDGLPDTTDRGLLWSTLAQAQARTGPEGTRTDAVRLAHNRFLDVAARASAEELQDLLDFGLEAPPRGERT